MAARLVDATTGAPLPRREVRVCTQVAPTYATRCAVRTTDTSGEVRRRITLRAHTTVTLRFAGASDLASSTSRRLRYTVTSRARLTSTRHAVSVDVAPASQARVTLQRRVGTSWRQVTVRRTSLFGSSTFAGLRQGSYRVRVSSSQSLASVVSRAVRVG